MNSRFTSRNLTIAALMTALTALSAYITIPVFGPVPFTLQVLFVLLAGLVLGSRLGPLSMLAYLVLGLVAPVYAGGATGLGALLGPAGGYLWGFVVSAFVVGLIAERCRLRTVSGLIGAGLVGLCPIYALGFVWLTVQISSADWHVLLWGGVLQFIPLDIFKAVLAGTLAHALDIAQIQRPALDPDANDYE